MVSFNICWYLAVIVHIHSEAMKGILRKTCMWELIMTYLDLSVTTLSFTICSSSLTSAPLCFSRDRSHTFSPQELYI
jgi:hypothetical protein